MLLELLKLTGVVQDVVVGQDALSSDEASEKPTNKKNLFVIGYLFSIVGYSNKYHIGCYSKGANI